MTTIFVKTAIAFLVLLILGDIVGIIICTLFDIAPIRGNSGALPYAIWFVLGVFVGLFTTAAASVWVTGREDVQEGPEGAALTLRIFLSALVVAVAICVFFHWLYWSRGVAGDYYVPDSGPHTITYLVAALAMMWLLRLAQKPGTKA